MMDTQDGTYQKISTLINIRASYELIDMSTQHAFLNYWDKVCRRAEHCVKLTITLPNPIFFVVVVHSGGPGSWELRAVSRYQVDPRQ